MLAKPVVHGVDENVTLKFVDCYLYSSLCNLNGSFKHTFFYEFMSL